MRVIAAAVLWLQCSIYELRKLPNRCQVSEEVAPSRGSGVGAGDAAP